MALREEFEAQGNWLFRHRSYLPLGLLPLLAAALLSPGAPAASRALTWVWDAVCLGLAGLGAGIRALTVGHVPAGTSARVTTRQDAESLNTTGLYSLVRHPLYLGNVLIGMALVLIVGSWWFAAVSLLAFWIYYERIMYAEEAYLRRRFGEPFEEWAESTPPFVPRPSGWRSPELPFSLKTVLRLEHPTFLLITCGLPALKMLAALLRPGRAELEPFWVLFFALGVITYAALRAVDRRTRFLRVHGR